MHIAGCICFLFVIADVKQCLEGVGLISTDERTGITVLEKGVLLQFLSQ